MKWRSSSQTAFFIALCNIARRNLRLDRALMRVQEPEPDPGSDNHGMGNDFGKVFHMDHVSERKQPTWSLLRSKTAKLQVLGSN